MSGDPPELKTPILGALRAICQKTPGVYYVLSDFALALLLAKTRCHWGLAGTPVSPAFILTVIVAFWAIGWATTRGRYS